MPTAPTPLSYRYTRRRLLLAALAGWAGTVAGSAWAAIPQATPAKETASVQDLVAAAIAGDPARLQRISADLKARPRPARGDRRRARDFNEHGLALWQRRRFDEAAAIFRQAHEADPSDSEIAENLGYALLKAGRIADAEGAMLEALEIDPDRGSAWGSLGLIYAKQGKHRDAIACVLTGYGYTANRKRALDAYTRLAATDEDPKVRAMLTDVVARLSK